MVKKEKTKTEWSVAILQLISKEKGGRALEHRGGRGPPGHFWEACTVTLEKYGRFLSNETFGYHGA